MRFARSLAAFAFLAISGCTASAETVTSSESAVASKDDACARLLEAIKPAVDAALLAVHTQDVGIGVITNDCSFQGYNAGKNAIAPDALYRVGSITKSYTSALILDLADDGLLDLDESIARFELGLPNADRITVRQLLDNSSGIFNYTEDPAFGQHLDWTPKERLAVGAAHDVYFEPGQGWHYSNTNFVALGFIAEQVGGADVATLVRTRVLAPQRLEHTFFDGEEALGGELAPGFAHSGAAFPESFSLIGAWADGAMAATLEDTTRWMRHYAGRTELQTPGVAIPGTPMTYSNALFHLPAQVTADREGHGHGGDIPGFHSWAIHVPERGWTITAIVNQDGGDANAFLIKLMDALKACTADGRC